MADPKPIVLTQTDTNPSSQDPQPLIVVGGNAVLDYTEIADYDAAETQTLKHVSGELTWVTDV